MLYELVILNAVPCCKKGNFYAFVLFDFTPIHVYPFIKNQKYINHPWYTQNTHIDNNNANCVLSRFPGYIME